jgi:tetratricopeptide (TPR) repeat protein
MYRPSSINQTIFWNTSFESGYSLFQTTFTTNGLLAGLALVFVIVISLIHGFRLFNYQFPDRFSRFIAVAALIMLVAFTWLFFFASPGLMLITYGFMYIGLLLGVSTLVGRTRLVSINYLRDPRLSFFAILILVVAAMAGFSAVYFSGNRYASIVVYNRALLAGVFETAARRIDRAISLSQNDLYWRTRSALYVNQFGTLAQKETPDKGQVQTAFSQAEQSAGGAVSWDPTLANNWLSISQVYQLVVGGENADAYKNAKQAADQAVSLAPTNPLYLLNEAQLAAANKDTAGALEYIGKAIALKPDYLDAFLLKAQIERAGGDTQAFKKEISAYLEVAPFDDQGYIYLGQAELDLKDYDGALDAFAKAKELDPTNPNNYLNYIGVLELMGNRTQAVEELRNFQKRFPNVTGVEEQIKRIQNGSAVTTPSADTTSGASTNPGVTPAIPKKS